LVPASCVRRTPNQTRIRKGNIEMGKGHPNPQDRTRLGGILTKPFRAARNSLGEGAATRSKPSRPSALVIAMLAMLAIIISAIGIAVPLGSVQATPGSGISRELLGRAMLDSFRSNQPPDFLIHSKSEKDVTIEKVTIPPGGHTGWHSHPGPAFAIVTKGKSSTPPLPRRRVV
jgi:hypothetical protein